MATSGRHIGKSLNCPTAHQTSITPSLKNNLSVVVVCGGAGGGFGGFRAVAEAHTPTRAEVISDNPEIGNPPERIKPIRT